MTPTRTAAAAHQLDGLDAYRLASRTDAEIAAHQAELDAAWDDGYTAGQEAAEEAERVYRELATTYAAWNSEQQAQQQALDDLAVALEAERSRLADQECRLQAERADLARGDRTSRCCDCCARPLPPRARSDSRFCGDACRKRAHRDRSAAA